MQLLEECGGQIEFPPLPIPCTRLIQAPPTLVSSPDPPSTLEEDLGTRLHPHTLQIMVAQGTRKCSCLVPVVGKQLDYLIYTPVYISTVHEDVRVLRSSKNLMSVLVGRPAW